MSSTIAEDELFPRKEVEKHLPKLQNEQDKKRIGLAKRQR
jgi:hypothetical protein